MQIPYKISEKQHEFIVNRYNDPLAILCTGVGFGKSRAAAVWLALQCASSKQRCIVIAQNYAALTEVMFRELEILFASWNIKCEHKKSKKKLILSNGSEIFGGTSENPSGLLGLSEIAILVIDEAAYCKEDIYNFMRDRMRGSGKQSKVRLLSSPNGTAANNWFCKLVHDHPECVINASTLDNPFTEQSFKDEICSRYEQGSPMYLQQVLGQIQDVDVANAVIKVSELNKHPILSANPNKVWVGVDVAAQGRDSTVFCVINDQRVVEFIQLQKADTQLLVSTMLDISRHYEIQGVAIDTTGGFGNGLFDLTKTRIANMVGINFGAASDSEYYANKRTEMYFTLNEAFKQNFYVTPDPYIIEELRYTLYYINASGKSALVPKDDIKRVLGRSPDSADALALAVYAWKNGVHSVDARTVAMKMLAARAMCGAA